MKIVDRIKRLWQTRRARIDRARAQAVTAAAATLAGLQNAQEIAAFTVQAMLLIEQVSGKKLPGSAKALAVVEFLARAIKGIETLAPIIYSAITRAHQTLNELDGWDVKDAP